MENEPSSKPAGETTHAELSKIMTDKNHPDHQGYWAGDPKVQEKVAEMYRKAYPDASPSAQQESLTSHSGGQKSLSSHVDAQPGETPDEAEVRARNDLIVAPLKEEWGQDFEVRMSSARAAAGRLFETRGDWFDELGAIVRVEYGPKGETAALRFLAELETIKQGG